MFFQPITRNTPIHTPAVYTGFKLHCVAVCWIIGQTISSCVSDSNFLTQSSLIQTGHHLSGPLCSLPTPPSSNNISLFSFICPSSLPRSFAILAHLNGQSLGIYPAISPHSFTISCPPPLLHPSLIDNALKLTLPLCRSPRPPHSYPSVQTSVSKRLGDAVPSRVYRFG